MSYPLDLDEMAEDKLRAELRRREKARAAGRCDYCDRTPDTRPCKFPERHEASRARPATCEVEIVTRFSEPVPGREVTTTCGNPVTHYVFGQDVFTCRRCVVAYKRAGISTIESPAVATPPKEPAPKHTISVWHWSHAPKELRELSTHGGDEDWVALVPHAVLDAVHYVPWLEDGTAFGCCSVSQHEHPDGVVYIGAHA